jgi:hypothetical protein
VHRRRVRATLRRFRHRDLLAIFCWPVFEAIGDHEPRLRGGALIGSMVAALASALGSLPALFSQRFSQRTDDAILGFCAGVLMAASAFSCDPGAVRGESTDAEKGVRGLAGGNYLVLDARGHLNRNRKRKALEASAAAVALRANADRETGKACA